MTLNNLRHNSELTHSPVVANSTQDISSGNQIPPIKDELAYLTDDEVCDLDYTLPPQNFTQNSDPDTNYDERTSAENAIHYGEERE